MSLDIILISIYSYLEGKMVNGKYKKLDFKIPVEAVDYIECSEFVVSQIEDIIKDSIQAGKNKIIIQFPIVYIDSFLVLSPLQLIINANTICL
jgi:hypothetical protein